MPLELCYNLVKYNCAELWYDLIDKYNSWLDMPNRVIYKESIIILLDNILLDEKRRAGLARRM